MVVKLPTTKTKEKIINTANEKWQITYKKMTWLTADFLLLAGMAQVVEYHPMHLSPFYSQSGHTHGLWVWSLVRERIKGNGSVFLFLSLSKISKKKNENLYPHKNLYTHVQGSIACNSAYKKSTSIINKTQHNHKMEYYSATKKDKY